MNNSYQRQRSSLSLLVMTTLLSDVMRRNTPSRTGRPVMDLNDTRQVAVTASLCQANPSHAELSCTKQHNLCQQTSTAFQWLMRFHCYLNVSQLFAVQVFKISKKKNPVFKTHQDRKVSILVQQSSHSCYNIKLLKKKLSLAYLSLYAATICQ